MIIANPIYDIVFKYLLDDEKVARILLSALLGQTVEEVHCQATELRSELGRPTVTILHLDFKARVRLEDGSARLVLIEVQKARGAGAVKRFRKYLGHQYGDPSNVEVAPDGTAHPLLLVAIYFLGEVLEQVRVPVLRVGRTWRDGITGEEVQERERFVENLTHDCIVVQIPLLKGRRRTDLETLLSIFDQDRVTGDPHKLDIQETELPERYREVLRRLQRAVSEREVRDTMDMEDQYLSVLQAKDRTIEDKDRALEDKDRALEDKDRALEDKDRVIENKDQVIDDKVRVIEDQARELEVLRRAMNRSRQGGTESG